MAMTPKEHIEKIRKVKFKIGAKEPIQVADDLCSVTEDLHQAVKNLSAELYAKDVHFLMEIIQNAEDNEYSEGVKPSLEFVMTTADITATGAPATLLIFNNEKGFSSKNINSICSLGNSTKKGNRQRGYIGEKGIGFKSVFLITAQPYIYSNGYQIMFSEHPCPDCDVGYIVPQWVEHPTVAEIQQTYGSAKSLPTTTIILPLNPDKVHPVKQQLSSIHPELLLFLSKIKRLSVREANKDPKLNTLRKVSISSETELVSRKNVGAESYTLHLSAEENTTSTEGECRYYMRTEVDEWVITLAFPFSQRLNRGMSSPGIYAFLETILLDNKWNQGILDCVPLAFINAFTSLIKSSEAAPLSTLSSMFKFIPIKPSSYPKLDTLRESIKMKLMEENIIPSEFNTEQKFFYKPREVGRILPAFWTILMNAQKQGVSLHNLSSHGKKALSSAFDKSTYDDILEFLEVKGMDSEWYAKCILSSNLVDGVQDDLYTEILFFLSEYWGFLSNTNMKSIPLLKYINESESVSFWSITEATTLGGKLCLSKESRHTSWLIVWNNRFQCFPKCYFMPESTQEALQSFSKRETVRNWLFSFGLSGLSILEYADLLFDSLKSAGKNHVINCAHFLYQSLSRYYLSGTEVHELCKKMPLVDKYGCVSTQRNGVLVPARGSNWVKLIGSNPWRQSDYVELSEKYSQQLMAFLTKYIGASDIPHICPPDEHFPAAYSPLTKENTFLLLEWIQNLRHGRNLVQGNFLSCIKEGSWLRTCLGGSTSYRPPSQSFLLTDATSGGSLLQNGSELVDIPLVDQQFYGSRINEYKEELKSIGVMFEFGEACKFVGKRLMSLAANSNLTKSNVFSILRFIRLLRDKYLPLDDFIMSIKDGSWLKTRNGNLSPVDSILFDSEWKVAAQISNLPLIDNDYYGEDISGFKAELELLGIVADFFRMPASLTVEATFLILECVRHTDSSTLVNVLKNRKWLNTGVLKSPSECSLYNAEWGCLLKVFHGFPSISEEHYGPDIVSYKDELKKLGVVVDFDEAAKVFAIQFKQHASSSPITKENVLSFLSCYRHLEKTLPMEVNKCLREEKWLQTRLGRRSPDHSILCNPDWETLSPIVSLPLIDDRDKGYGREIIEYREELKAIGVVAEFSSGMKFVVAGLNIPSNPSVIAAPSFLSLLNCIKILLTENKDLPKEFLKRVNRRWLKTSMGYRDPGSCLLFESKWSSLLQHEDGPFIDDEFYCSKIASYSKELEAIGVIKDAQHGCSLIASHLESHSQFSVIARIYKCLCHFHWGPQKGATKEPMNEDSVRLFIPNGSNVGRWVWPEECVLYDKDNLFGLQLNVLEKHYEKDLLNYFCFYFGVRQNPNADDYCKLWKKWESTKQKLTSVECRAFWLYIAEYWNLKKTQKLLSEKLLKLPVSSKDSAEILLLEKDAVLIPDDLPLQDCLEQASPDPLFVWYPKPSFPSVTKSKLNEIFASVGVRTISESVNKEGSSHLDTAELRQITSKGTFIKRGLVRIILAFLADPSLGIDFEKRRQMVTYLLDLMVFETEEPITATYGLKLSTGSILKVDVSRMIRWERENMKLFTQKIERSSAGHKENIAYATYFSEVIAEGLLWEKADQISGLSELIKLGWLLDFEEEAISFLLKSKNLQLCYEDEEFLKSAFAPE
ncbi:hypothetical protein MKW98_012155 [Papaver atlanticum]|uniref:Sacsin/Nov domain-containing protein n=1 Tax=Papaver atlanticum TaxID=357466 RepID=A0AAD4T106_9MAGN|nr:hypothetical protein MKW98_012155 [Papaver atlanticum]